MRRRSRGAAAALALVVLLAGCTSGSGDGGDPGDGQGSGLTVPRVGPADIDVDTPRLRRLKAEAGVEPCVPGDGDPVEGGLPAVVLPCFGGGEDVDLATLRGPLLVNLWAAWCGPCREEMPLLQEFHERFGEQVGVLGINWQDTQVGGAMTLVGDSGVTYPLLADPQNDLSGQGTFPNLRGLPFLAFVDADGRVVHQEYVIITSVDQLVAMVAEHLEVAL